MVAVASAVFPAWFSYGRWNDCNCFKVLYYETSSTYPGRLSVIWICLSQHQQSGQAVTQSWFINVFRTTKLLSTIRKKISSNKLHLKMHKMWDLIWLLMLMQETQTLNAIKKFRLSVCLSTEIWLFQGCWCYILENSLVRRWWFHICWSLIWDLTCSGEG